MIDFGALPPEINSGRMYVGAGPTSLVGAAAAWQALAAGLMAAAGGMTGITAALVTGPWTGPSSALMGMSHLQFIAWVFDTAATAEKAAAAASLAAGAYDTAFAATIPPEEVERNQITTATLIATNFLGVNSAAIAASQAQYQEYWAQDASAMYAYAADNEAIAASLNAPPFLPAIPDTDPAGLGAQAASVGQATGESAGQAASTVGGANSQLGSMASSLGSAATAPMQAVTEIPKAMTEIPKALGQLVSPMSQLFAGSPLSNMFGGGGMLSSFGFGGGASGFGALGSLGGTSPTVTASMGSSGVLPSGRLSVPASWAGSVEQSSVARPFANSAEPIMSEQPETFGSGAAPRGMMAPMMSSGSAPAVVGTTTDKSRKMKPMVF